LPEIRKLEANDFASIVQKRCIFHFGELAY